MVEILGDPIPLDAGCEIAMLSSAVAPGLPVGAAEAVAGKWADDTIPSVRELWLSRYPSVQDAAAQIASLPEVIAACPTISDRSLIVNDEGAGTISLVSAEDGKPVWTINATLTEGGTVGGGAKESGIVLLPISGDRRYVTALDLNTGEALYELRVSDDGNWWRTVLAMTSSTIYLAGGEEGNLLAVDARTGATRWSVDNPYSNWYEFRLWGGQLVAVSTVTDDSFGQHPAILGVG